MSKYRAIPEFYDAEYQCREMLAHDVPFFLARLPAKPQSILELAAGTGRATIQIAQCGHRVVGVDYDKAMLDIARKKRDALGMGDKQLSLIHQDILHLNLRQKFDCACIFFNTFVNFTTLEEQDALLQSARKHLKRNGRFWLDIFNPDLALLSRSRGGRLDPTLFHVPESALTVLRETDIRSDPVQQKQHVTFYYQWFDTHGRQRRKRVEFDLTWIFPRELRILLERNGLRVEALYGDYDGCQLDNNSPRIIADCRLK